MYGILAEYIYSFLKKKKAYSPFIQSATGL